jgi:hypothetical protein
MKSGALYLLQFFFKTSPITTTFLTFQRQQQQQQRYLSNKKATYPSQRNPGLMPDSDYRTLNNMMEDEKNRVFAQSQSNWKVDPTSCGPVTQTGRRTHSASSNRREPGKERSLYLYR